MENGGVSSGFRASEISQGLSLFSDRLNLLILVSVADQAHVVVTITQTYNKPQTNEVP